MAEKNLHLFSLKLLGIFGNIYQREIKRKIKIAINKYSLNDKFSIIEIYLKYYLRNITKLKEMMTQMYLALNAATIFYTIKQI